MTDTHTMTNTDTNTDTDTDTGEYRVAGMTCGGCASSVTKAIQKVAPSSTVQVTLEGGTVRVEGAHDEAAVRDAVEGAGFDFLGRQG